MRLRDLWLSCDAHGTAVGERRALASEHPGSYGLWTLRLLRPVVHGKVMIHRSRHTRQLPMAESFLAKIMYVYADGLFFELLHGGWRSFDVVTYSSRRLSAWIH